MKQKFLLWALAGLFAFFLYHSLVFSNNTAAVTGVQLKVKVFLKGALFNSNNQLMRDDLRKVNYLPADEPYTHHVGPDGGAETVNSNTVFAVTGSEAIVDWIFIELRDTEHPEVVVATRSALLQRNGEVVDIDGISASSFIW